MSGPGKQRQETGWRLTLAEVVLEQTRVYKNDRQQVTVSLYMEAKISGRIVELSDTERASIRLMDYITEEPIPMSNGESEGHYDGWTAQSVHRGYAPLFDSGPLDDRPTGWRRLLWECFQWGRRHWQCFLRRCLRRQRPGLQLRIYLSAGPSVIANNPLRVAFLVRGDDNSTWLTSGIEITPEGTRQNLSAIDTTDRHRVSALEPIAYSAQNFQIERTPLGRKDNQAGIFNAVEWLSIVEAGGQTVGIRSMTCSPAGMIHWINNLPDTSNPCFTGYAPPREQAIRWNPDVPTGSLPLPVLGLPDADKGAIVICGRIDIRRGGITDPPQGPVRITIIDIYGSNQACTLVFVAGTRDELQIR